MNQLSNIKRCDIENILIQLFAKNCCGYLNLDYEKIEIKKTESPDFVLRHDDDYIGIEITRALDQNLQKTVSIRNNKFKNTSFCPASFEDTNMKSEDIEKLLEKSKYNIIGKPYRGDDLEEKVICDVINAIKRKLKKFDKYTQYERNILLVHLEDRVTLNHDFVINKLKEYVSKNDMRFNYICLKLSNVFHFLSGGEYFSCAIKT